MRDFTIRSAQLRRLVLGTLLASMSPVLFATTKGPDPGGYSGTDATVYSFVDISGGSGGASCEPGPFALTSPEFEEGGPIEEKFRCTGDNVSPALSWSCGPAGTLSYAVTQIHARAPDCGGFAAPARIAA